MILIAKRLTGDLAAFAHPEKTQKNAAFRLPSWAVQTVYAQPSPCEMDDASDEIMDWAALASTTGLAKLMDFLESKGMGAAGTIGSMGNYAGIVAAYVQLILSHLAFDIQFEMDGPPPLIRTTARRLQSGETKTLIATVKMDVGKVQWINCFRIVLNAMGLDFKVDNNGPVKGASVSWEGISGFSDAAIYRGGPEQLVRFVNDPGSRIQTGGAITPHNTITDQLTDKDGKARVNVEGVGQRENLGSQPRPVMKQATGGAMVALKPADMYRDLKDAGATALGGLARCLRNCCTARIGPSAAGTRFRFRTGKWAMDGVEQSPILGSSAGQSGEIAPRRQTRWRTPILTPDLPRLEMLITEQPDRTLAELQQALGTSASLATIWRAIERLAITIKKDRTRVRAGSRRRRHGPD